MSTAGEEIWSETWPEETGWYWVALRPIHGTVGTTFRAPEPARVRIAGSGSTRFTIWYVNGEMLHKKSYPHAKWGPQIIPPPSPMFHESERKDP